MPYYRRNYRRRTFRPRGTTRKRVYRRKFSRFGRRKMNTNVYYFKRKSSAVFDWAANSQLTQLTQRATGSPSWYNIAFRLQDVPNFTDFTNVYDSYRIRGVKVNLIPMGNVSSSNQPGTPTGAAGNYAVRCFSAYDPNNDGVGVTGSTAIQQLQEYQNCKWSPFNRIHKRYVKPRVTVTSPDGSGGINLAGKQPWIQCADSGGTVHYGMPVAIDDSGFATASLLYKIECTYYLQFARPK